MAGGSAGYAGRGITGITDDAFILLAAWCFARSSPRFHAWFCTAHGLAAIYVSGRNIMRCPRRKTTGDFAYFDYVYDFAVFVQMPWVRIMLLVILACLLFICGEFR